MKPEYLAFDENEYVVALLRFKPLLDGDYDAQKANIGLLSYEDAVAALGGEEPTADMYDMVFAMLCAKETFDDIEAVNSNTATRYEAIANFTTEEIERYKSKLCKELYEHQAVMSDIVVIKEDDNMTFMYLSAGGKFQQLENFEAGFRKELEKQLEQDTKHKDAREIE